MTHVLVAVDFSTCSRGAFDHAAALARGMGARITALHVSPHYATTGEWSDASVPASADPERWQALHEDLRALAARSDDPVPSIVVREGDPAEEILAYAGLAEADFVVLGTHGRRGLRRWMSGSVTERVACTARCPVIAVPHAASVPFERVLCAIDLTDDSRDTMAYAAAAARAMHAHLIVLHAVQPPPAYEPWMIPPNDDETARRTLSESAHRHLRDLSARYAGGDLPVEVRVTFGTPHGQIERLARSHVALTVLGVRSSRAVQRFFFGSTARHVLRSAVSPVMLVPHRAAAAKGQDREQEKTVVS
jgi:nucleotide-binding universal stress UspA family protein